MAELNSEQLDVTTAEYFGWVPSINLLRFSLFDPDSQDDSKICKAFTANFSTGLSGQLATRSLCSYAFRNTQDDKVERTESDFKGEMRYYLIAQKNEKTEDQLSGKVIVTNSECQSYWSSNEKENDLWASLLIP